MLLFACLSHHVSKTVLNMQMYVMDCDLHLAAEIKIIKITKKQYSRITVQQYYAETTGCILYVISKYGCLHVFTEKQNVRKHCFHKADLTHIYKLWNDYSLPLNNTRFYRTIDIYFCRKKCIDNYFFVWQSCKRKIINLLDVLVLKLSVL